METLPQTLELTTLIEPFPTQRTEHVFSSSAEKTPPSLKALSRDEVFAQLMDRCWQRAYWIAFDFLGNAAEAEDLCQDALLRAYEKWDSFREESSIDTWFYRILTNLSLNRKRRHGIWNRVRDWLRSEGEQDQEGIHLPASINPEKQLQSKEIGEAVQRAMNHLPQQQRTVFVLRYLQHFSLKEISEITELAEGTVKTHIFRALKTMRTHLEDSR